MKYKSLINLSFFKTTSFSKFWVLIYLFGEIPPLRPKKKMLPRIGPLSINNKKAAWRLAILGTQDESPGEPGTVSSGQNGR
jgi:hypothetical protein